MLAYRSNPPSSAFGFTPPPPRLRDYIIVSRSAPTIAAIQAAVANYYEINLSDMLSSRKARLIAYPRQVAMMLAKQLTPKSLPDIGRRFNRDHTTVMHALKAVEQRMAIDAGLAADVEALRERLTG